MPDTQPESKPEPRSKSGRWTALSNLSISRSGPGTDKAEKAADIVHKGETVTLTEEVAQGFLHNHRRPVIRPFDEKNDKDPNLTARDLFGQRPPAEAFGARPDPPGASTVTVNDEIADPADPRNAPEANDPKTDFSVDPAAAKDKGTGVKPK
jgi:hypothetical protein